MFVLDRVAVSALRRVVLDRRWEAEPYGSVAVGLNFGNLGYNDLIY
jgi:hypothetical protein